MTVPVLIVSWKIWKIDMHVLYTHLNWFKENGFCVFISHIKLHALVYGGKARLDVLVSLWHYIMQFFRCCKWLLSQSDTFDSLLLLQVYDYLSLKYIIHISQVQELKNLSIFACKTLQVFRAILIHKRTCVHKLISISEYMRFPNIKFLHMHVSLKIIEFWGKKI